jgi:hypothetical protein
VEWEAGGRVEVGELDNRKLIHSHSRTRTSVFAFFLFPFFLHCSESAGTRIKGQFVTALFTHCAVE